MAHRDAALHRLRQREAERAGLADDADGVRLQRPPLRHRREREPGAGGVVHQPDRVRADQTHVRVARDPDQPRLQGDMLRLGGLGEASGEDHDGADAARRAFARDRLDALARCGDHHAIRGLRQRRDAGKTGAAGKLRMPGADLVEPPVERLHVGDRARPEGVGAFGDAHHRHAARRDEAGHLVARVQSAARRHRRISAPWAPVASVSFIFRFSFHRMKFSFIYIRPKRPDCKDGSATWGEKGDGHAISAGSR